MLRSHRVRRRGLAGVAAVALSVGLAACADDSRHDGDDGASGIQTASNGDVFNAADVEFATSMIPHHAQAIQMVTLTGGRTLDPPVQQLANQIRDAQVPEVETMSDWLSAWGEEIPETSLDHVNAGHDMSEMPSMDSSHDDMPGMMSAEEMQALADASDAEFQTMWLEMMVEHHEGAIEMAKTEQAEGKYPDAIALAEAIETAQQAEIATIQALSS
jgi:uncharacterized protein (DUF305 family)